MSDDVTYTFAGVAKILEISESRLRYWSQVGFVGPSVRRGGKQLFNFQDLVSVKAAKELADRGFKAGEVRKALDAVRASLPHIPRPLDRIRVSFDGKALVVVDEGGAYDVTGQRVFDFGLGDLARRITDVGQGGAGSAVTPLPGATDDSGVAFELADGDGGRNAYDWFMEGTRLEARPDLDPADDQAVLAFRRALALDPGLAPAHTNLGIISYRRGDRARAQRELRDGAGAGPGSAGGALQPGELDSRRGRSRIGGRRAAARVADRARLRRRPLQPGGRAGASRWAGPGARASGEVHHAGAGAGGTLGGAGPYVDCPTLRLSSRMAGWPASPCPRPCSSPFPCSCPRPCSFSGLRLAGLSRGPRVTSAGRDRAPLAPYRTRTRARKRTRARTRTRTRDRTPLALTAALLL